MRNRLSIGTRSAVEIEPTTNVFRGRQRCDGELWGDAQGQASRLALLFTEKRRQSTGAKMALQSSIRAHFTTPRQKTAQSDYEELASPNYYT
jgi:hypothetical protein